MLLDLHTDKKGAVRTVNGQIDQKTDDQSSLDITRVAIFRKAAVKIAKRSRNLSGESF